MRKELDENADLNLLSYTDLMNYKPDPKDEILGVNGGLLRRGLPTFLQGWQNAGKSVLAFQLGVHVALGVPFLGMKVKRPCRVLYVSIEGDELRWRSDLKSIVSHMRADGVKVDEKLLGDNFVTSSPENDFQESVERVVELRKPELIIVDNFQSFAPGGNSSNNPDVFRLWQKPLTRLVRKEKIALLVLMHFIKPGNKDNDPLEVDPDLGAYAAAGPAGQANWVRHSIELMYPKDKRVDNRYRLRFSKRPETSGLLEKDGVSPVRFLLLERSAKGIEPYWSVSPNQSLVVKGDDPGWKRRLVESLHESHSDWKVGDIVKHIAKTPGQVVTRQYVTEILGEVKKKK